MDISNQSTRWIRVFVLILLIDQSRAHSVFNASVSVSAIKYDDVMDIVYVADGNEIFELSSDFNGIDSIEIGKKYEAENDCPIFDDSCKNVLNEITVLETIERTNDQYMMFVCLKLGYSGNCYVIDTMSDVKEKIEFVNSSSIKSFSTSHAATSFVNTDTNKNRYIMLSHNVNLKQRLVFSSVFLNMKITYNTVTPHRPEVTLHSDFKLHGNHEFYVNYGFLYNEMAYYVVQYTLNSNFTHSIIRIQLSEDNVTLLESRVQCRQMTKYEDSKMLAKMVDSKLYLVYTGENNDNAAICEIELDLLETHFDRIYENWARRNVASNVDWINGLESNGYHRLSIPQCYGKTGAITKCCILAPSSWQLQELVPKFSTIGKLTGLDVVHIDSVTLMYLLNKSGVVQKIQVSPIFEKLSSHNLSSTSANNLPSSSMWHSDKHIYIRTNKTIEQLAIMDCQQNTEMGTCLRDVPSCTWCQPDITRSSPHCVPSNTNCNAVKDYTEADIRISAISPQSSPMQGGTYITVHGDNLDMADTVNVVIGQKPCVVIQPRSSGIVRCVAPSFTASSSDVIFNTTMSIALSGPVRKVTTFPFMFYSMDNGVRVLHNRTIRSGGIKVVITGRNIGLSDDYYMYVKEREDTTLSPIYTTCKVLDKDEDTIECMTPPVSLSTHISSTNQPSFHLSTSVLDTSSPSAISSTIPVPLTTYNDPTILIHHYDNENNVSNNSPDHLQGAGFAHFPRSEIQIMSDIDGALDITFVNDTEIRCNLPSSRKTHKITVRFGMNIIYFCGIIDLRAFDTNDTWTDPVTTKRHLATSSAGDQNESDKSIGVGSEATTEPQTKELNDFVKNNIEVIIVSISVVVVFLLSLLVCRKRIMAKIHKRRGRLERNRSSIVSYRGARVYIGDIGTQNSHSMTDGDDNMLTDILDDSAVTLIQRFEEEELLIARDSLDIVKLIGQGNFGSVYKGFLTAKNMKFYVAIKTLHKNEHRDMDVTQFLKEAYIMKNLRHKNVMRLVGICLEKEEMPLVILPFMDHGDLLSYLHEDKHIPTVKDLVSFGLDIAQGMEYLAELKFVHRDLAARNCMLDADFTVKVADFGLSRDVYETSYYSTKSKGTKLPVKWMAVESLSDGVFDEKTDVWSFGITLWELMTRGVRPYAAVDNWDMERYLKSGRRLPQPMFCPTPLYKMMRRCWALDPADRPSFCSIRQCIDDMLEKVHLQLGDAQKNSNIGSVYVNLTSSSKCTYENIENFEELPV